MITERYTLIRGATLSLAGSATLPAGTWAATSQVRGKNGNLLANLTVTLGAAVSGSTPIALASGDTSGWPVGDALCDIRFEDSDGGVLFSPPFIIDVEEGVTR